MTKKILIDTWEIVEKIKINSENVSSRIVPVQGRERKKTSFDASLIVYLVKTDKLSCIDKQLTLDEMSMYAWKEEVKTTGMLNKP